MSGPPDWKPEPDSREGRGSVLRGCAIAAVVSFLILAFIVGQCFI